MDFIITVCLVLIYGAYRVFSTQDISDEFIGDVTPEVVEKVPVADIPIGNNLELRYDRDAFRKIIKQFNLG